EDAGQLGAVGVGVGDLLLLGQLFAEVLAPLEDDRHLTVGVLLAQILEIDGIALGVFDLLVALVQLVGALERLLAALGVLEFEVVGVHVIGQDAVEALLVRRRLRQVGPLGLGV